MSQSVAKLSVSVPTELAKAVRKRVGGRGLSGFVATAITHELERVQLAGLVEEMDRALGSVPEVSLRAARRAWPKR